MTGLVRENAGCLILLGGWAVLLGDADTPQSGKAGIAWVPSIPGRRRMVQRSRWGHRMSTSHLQLATNFQCPYALHTELSLKSVFTWLIYCQYPPVTSSVSDLEQASSPLWPSISQSLRCKDPLECTHSSLHTHSSFHGREQCTGKRMPSWEVQVHRVLPRKGSYIWLCFHSIWWEIFICTDSESSPRPMN